MQNKQILEMIERETELQCDLSLNNDKLVHIQNKFRKKDISLEEYELKIYPILQNIKKCKDELKELVSSINTEIKKLKSINHEEISDWLFQNGE